jgi:hypothetical protein
MQTNRNLTGLLLFVCNGVVFALDLRCGSSLRIYRDCSVQIGRIWVVQRHQLKEKAHVDIN